MNRKIYRTLLLVCAFGLFIVSCTKEDLKSEKTTQIGKFNAKLLPTQPKSSEEIFIIDSICKYEKFQSLQIKSYTILYSRSFNSMMKLPCVPKIDTISLGRLEKGRYTLIYSLIDKSELVQDSVYLVDTLLFDVQE